MHTDIYTYNHTHVGTLKKKHTQTLSEGCVKWFIE